MIGNNERLVGTCSICGGEVVLPVVYWIVVQPVPACKRCGAKTNQPKAPVIDMEPSKTPPSLLRYL